MTTTPNSENVPNSKENTGAAPRTWKPAAAGILIILAGILAIVADIIYLTTGSLGIFAGVPFIESSANPAGGILIITGIIGILGGVFALLRRIWWLTIIGVIFSMFFCIWPVLVMGIVSIILIATSRAEFRRIKA